MYKTILLPVDVNESVSQAKAVETAVGLAELFAAHLHVLSIVPDMGMSVVSSFFPEDYEQKATEAARQALHAFTAEHIPDSLPVQHIVAHGTVYHEILHYAAEQGADLIVMASHRPAIEDYLIGPNAAQVVRHARCSVMVVRN